MATLNPETTNPMTEESNPESPKPTRTRPTPGLVDSLASLKLSVVLFSLSLFLVLVGTFAQAHIDIWQVMNQYFRCFFAWIEFQHFFPKAWFPSMQELGAALDKKNIPRGFWFPGGWTIGGLMTINLLAAHTLRFKIQAKGSRLSWGMIVTAVGILASYLVVEAGMVRAGVQDQASVNWDLLWQAIRYGMIVPAVICGIEATRRKKEEKTEFWTLAICTLCFATLATFLLAGGDALRLNNSAMRILWQLIQGLGASMILLAGCYLLFKKRAGIVLLHAGILLLMINELVVAGYHKEMSMPIEEGQTVNYASDTRTPEIAVIDRSNPEHDSQTVIPNQILLSHRNVDEQEEKLIQHPDLPVDLKLVAYYTNAATKPVHDGNGPQATIGMGTREQLVATNEVTGIQTDGQINAPGAYVELLDKQSGESLGTVMLWTLYGSIANLTETFEVDGKPYEIAMRFERVYKPYSFHLVDVRKDDYLGTNTPRNYSSDVRIVDQEHGEDRTVKIWMNNPLRFGGDTYYQSGYFKNPRTNIEQTTLQVVSNEGWMIPYLACMIVTAGMMFQFGLGLLRFLKRRERDTNQTTQSLSTAEGSTIPPKERMSQLQWAIAASIVLIFSGYLGSKLRPASFAANEYNWTRFGSLPVMYEGRIKPLDTLARNSLRILSGRETFTDVGEDLKSDQDDETRQAIEWLMTMITDPPRASEYRVFKIDHPELQKQLELERRKGHMYSISEFQDKIPELTEISVKARELREKNPGLLSSFQHSVLDLEKKLGVVDLTMSSFLTPETPETESMSELRQWMSAAMRSLSRLETRHPPMIIPPTTEKTTQADLALSETWTPLAKAEFFHNIAAAIQPDRINPYVTEFQNLQIAWLNKKPEEFNSAVENFHTLLAKNPPKNYNASKVQFETRFNWASPFFYCWVIYLICTALVSISWLTGGKGMSNGIFWLLTVTFIVHTIALMGRIYISGRPPVTNLYSSAVFIGWAGVMCGLILDYFMKKGIGLEVAAVSGAMTLKIAEGLAGDGDTFTVLQAVLDTQFWLATHVVCITLGYAATFVAGLLGIVYIGRGLLSTTLTDGQGKKLSTMIYGTVCFAMFFSFVGTVLGGLWADDSWGRFWGWDPKENGALMIVIWNALVLHARWDRLVSHRGLAALAIFGNVVTAWSWFGVNELGVGLHSYGFTDGALQKLGLFIASQLVFIAIAMIPKSCWRSGV